MKLLQLPPDENETHICPARTTNTYVWLPEKMTRPAEREDSYDWELFLEPYDVPEKNLKIDITNSKHCAKQFAGARF